MAAGLCNLSMDAVSKIEWIACVAWTRIEKLDNVDIDVIMEIISFGNEHLMLRRASYVLYVMPHQWCGGRVDKFIASLLKVWELAQVPYWAGNVITSAHPAGHRANVYDMFIHHEGNTSNERKEWEKQCTSRKSRALMGSTVLKS
jgi:hypothetical protein